jgi:hypothetical protein
MSKMPDTIVRAEPIPGFGTFEWMTGRWQAIFDRQLGLIQADLAKAHAEDRMVLYLSCPISGRGGGSVRTNVEVATFTARRLMHIWGERLFVLNPAAYQLESREGTGLVLEHIRQLFGSTDEEARREPGRYLDRLLTEYTPHGGDYLRMWVTALVDDRSLAVDAAKRGLMCGGLFDGIYFLGPSDVAGYFSSGEGASLTSIVETYFARKHASDPEFRQEFDFRGGSQSNSPTLLDLTVSQDRAEWEDRRKRFFRFYALRASASFSLGCRDEWNTLVRINRRRAEDEAYGAGEEMACYFDGRQVNPAASTGMVPRGYELVPST